MAGAPRQDMIRTLVCAAAIAVAPLTVSADSSLPNNSDEPERPSTLVCGDRRWRAMARAIILYCNRRSRAAVGCARLRRAFTTCSDLLTTDESESFPRATLRDSRNQSYAWFVTFAPRAERWRVESLDYRYDDCDAP